MKWEKKKLNELGSVSRGRSRHRPRDATHLYGGPYPFIQTGDVKHAGLYIREYSQTYSEAGLEQSKIWNKGTLCITIAANIADTTILAIDACFPDSVIGFVADTSRCDVRFVKYQLDLIREQYRNISQGVAQDNLSLEKLLSIDVLAPNIQTQNRIADVLSTYDALIENNRRRIALLEESARLLYQEWFVRLRFPGYEHTRIVDGVPEGWEKRFATEVIDFDPPTKVAKDRENWFVEMSCLSGGGMVIADFVKRYGNSGSKFQNGDTLFARITPCLENGKTGYVNFLPEDDVGLGSTEFIVMRGKRVSPEFVYCFARSRYVREKAIKSMIGASGRQRVQKSCFNDILVPLPPKRIAQQFDDIVKPIFSQIRVLDKQNINAKQARDLLLPKLMSGEVMV